MASEDSGDASAGHRRSSAEHPNTSLANDQVITSTEATFEQGARSDEENPSRDTGDSRNASDDGSCVKIGVEATLAGLTYDLGQSKSQGLISYLSRIMLATFQKGFPGHLVWSLF
jgi:hypothetical protein